MDGFVISRADNFKIWICGAGVGCGRWVAGRILRFPGIFNDDPVSFMRPVSVLKFRPVSMFSLLQSVWCGVCAWSDWALIHG